MYLRQSSNLSTVVHEGQHGLDVMSGFGKYGDTQLLNWERRAFKAQDDFNKATGGIPMFNNRLELDNFIKDNYSDWNQIRQY